MAARLAAEKLHKRDSKLTADNDRLEVGLRVRV